MPSSAAPIKRAVSRRRPASAQKSKVKSVRRKSTQATRVAILGGGRGGKALMEIFAQDPLARIVGLAESKTRTSGTKLAKQFGVPVTKDYRELLKLKDVDLIIDSRPKHIIDPVTEQIIKKIERQKLFPIMSGSRF